ncbi:MAG: hypothetical protein HY046_09600 [Acidobacteria bacterium]|nr:hypothetical protein [Acidobacteriota bacterium]
MVQILWEFVVKKENIEDFERYYSASGAWAALFAKSEKFRGTHLLRDTDHAGRFVTVDLWEDLGAFQTLRALHAKEYEKLDRACETFTEREHCIGVFQVS